MSLKTEVNLLTINCPFNYFMSHHPMCEVPRVVGIDDGDEIVWTPRQLASSPRLRYQRRRIAEVAIPCDELFRERLIGFFSTYLAEGSGGHEKDFNCHLFGRWMIGASLDSPEDSIEGPDETIQDGRITNSLEPDQRGVIGGWCFGSPDPAHSVIGLNDGSCIHIDGWQGPLLITSPDQALRKYVSTPYLHDPTYRAGVYITD